MCIVDLSSLEREMDAQNILVLDGWLMPSGSCSSGDGGD